MHKYIYSIIYQFCYFLCFIALVYTTRVDYYSNASLKPIQLYWNNKVLLLSGAIFFASGLHFYTLGVKNITTMPFIFRSDDEKEQNVLNEESHNGFSVYIPVLFSLLFSIFLIETLTIHPQDMEDWNSIFKLFLVIWFSSLWMPYMFYTWRVLRKIRS